MPDTSRVLRPLDIEHVGRVWVREGTSDYAVLEQIFHTEEFNISTAPQFAWIRAAYDRMLEAGETPLVIDCGANIGLSASTSPRACPGRRLSASSRRRTMSSLRARTPATIR